MIDAHAHLDADGLYEDLEGALKRALGAQVTAVVCAGFDVRAHPERRAHLGSIPGLLVAEGLHPWAVAEMHGEEELHDALSELERALGASPPGALGECGLDYYRAREEPARALQRQACRAQLKLAARFDLPAILHAVRCHEALITILKAQTPSRGVQLHGYSGSAKLVPGFIELGAVFSFGTPLTWSGQAQIKQALRAAVACDPSCWMLETDSPDRPAASAAALSRRGEPADLLEVAEAAALLLEWPLERVQRVSAENAARFFGLTTRLGTSWDALA